MISGTCPVDLKYLAQSARGFVEIPALEVEEIGNASVPELIAIVSHATRDNCAADSIMYATGLETVIGHARFSPGSPLHL